MIEVGEQADLAPDAIEQRTVAADALQRDHLAGAPIARGVDGAHTAGPGERFKIVMVVDVAEDLLAEQA